MRKECQKHQALKDLTFKGLTIIVLIRLFFNWDISEK